VAQIFLVRSIPAVEMCSVLARFVVKRALNAPGFVKIPPMFGVCVTLSQAGLLP
jgi:hypothetical protein